jgi:hypothetical protein
LRSATVPNEEREPTKPVNFTRSSSSEAGRCAASSAGSVSFLISASLVARSRFARPDDALGEELLRALACRSCFVNSLDQALGSFVARRSSW